jgi:chemotaxis protein methyltransferase CheR
VQQQLKQTSALEFDFSDSVFERFRELIYDKAGIQLADSKRSMVYNRLTRRIRELGLDGFESYLRLLSAGSGVEDQAFINALTTNMTSFFREDYHFPLLAKAIKEIIARQGSVSIWCSAASTGEEPYSIAITAADCYPDPSKVSILATDIDTGVLEAAKRAVYPIDTVRKVDPAMLQKHFLRGTGKNAGLVQVQPATKRLVQFAPFNLVQPSWQWREKFDIIFCRNVMIYFDRPTQLRLIDKFHQFLKPEGLLFVGHSESFSECREQFSLLGRTVYKRNGA